MRVEQFFLRGLTLSSLYRRTDSLWWQKRTVLSCCFFFFLFPSCPPGGLFHRNVQDLQRLNRPDRPGGVDWWAEGEGDRGQTQRVACSVHCRRRLREESWKAPLWMDHTLISFLRAVQTNSNGLNLIISLFPRGLITPIPPALHLPVSFSQQRLPATPAAEMPH